jgi:hypothetical protein
MATHFNWTDQKKSLIEIIKLHTNMKTNKWNSVLSEFNKQWQCDVTIPIVRNK